MGCQFVDVTGEVRRRRSAENDADVMRKRYAAAQDVVLTLQRNLLPTALPVLPGVRIAAHYLVAAAEQAAGGDWFEAVPVDGQVALVVGDVVGHGAQASAVMGQLRAVLVEFLLDGDDLATALARLDRFASRVTGARGATVCLALLDPTDGIGALRLRRPPAAARGVGRRDGPLPARARWRTAQPGRTGAPRRHRRADSRRPVADVLRRAGRADRPGPVGRDWPSWPRSPPPHCGSAPRR